MQDHFEAVKHDALLNGMVTSAVFPTAFLANLCVATLADNFGRTMVLYSMNIPFVIGAMVAAFANSPEMIIAGRAITGFAVGVAGTLPNLYIAEIAPVEQRGRCVGMAPLYGTTGIMAAQFASWIVAEVLGHERCGEIGWRIMFGLGAIPAVVQFLWSIGLPESPRWCHQRGLYERAEESSQYLSSLGIDTHTGAVTPVAPSSPTEKLGFSRGAIAVGLSVMQQLSGVNAVIYYAPHLYTQLGVAANVAILVAGLNSVAQVMMTRTMTLVVDSWGRRRICLIGLGGMFLGLLLLGAVFQNLLGLFAFSAHWAFAIAGILFFRLSFSLSLGPLPYIMVTELFPQRHRARGVATSMATNWLLNWAVVFVVPILVKKYQGLVFFAFAAVCVISAVIVDLWLPETSGRNLEDAACGHEEGFLRKVFCRRSLEAARTPDLMEPEPEQQPPSIQSANSPCSGSGLPTAATSSDSILQDQSILKVSNMKVKLLEDDAKQQDEINQKMQDKV